jgi:5,6-dimethylbenzimidazole synthase
METGKSFTAEEALVLEEIILNRRDVRGNRFLAREVKDEVLDKLLAAAVHAPSVGFSQPWEFVIIKDEAVKKQIKDCFNEENCQAKDFFKTEKQELYTRLKLEGIIEAPINMAVFYVPSAEPVLGQTSMQEAGLYSVVCAIQNMWLMARALNVGMGWVSILNPEKVKNILNAPMQHQLIGYLCIGYVDKFLTRPELETLQWEKSKALETMVHYDRYEPTGKGSRFRGV